MIQIDFSRLVQTTRELRSASNELLVVFGPKGAMKTDMLRFPIPPEYIETFERSPIVEKRVHYAEVILERGGVILPR